jgi:hypothetical protein
MGLGLAIEKQFVDNLRRVRVFNNPETGGAVFEISFRCRRIQAESPHLRNEINLVMFKGYLCGFTAFRKLHFANPYVQIPLLRKS